MFIQLIKGIFLIKIIFFMKNMIFIKVMFLNFFLFHLLVRLLESVYIKGLGIFGGEKMSKTFDRYTGIVFLLIGVFFIVESRKIAASAYGSSVGPDIFPIVLGILLVLLSIKLLTETLKYRREKAEKEKVDYKQFGIIFVSAVLYVALLEPLGYVITTFFFLLVGFQVIEKGSWLKSVIIAAAFSAGVYFIFVQLLQGSLPGFPI